MQKWVGEQSFTWTWISEILQEFDTTSIHTGRINVSSEFVDLLSRHLIAAVHLGKLWSFQRYAVCVVCPIIVVRAWDRHVNACITWVAAWADCGGIALFCKTTEHCCFHNGVNFCEPVATSPVVLRWLCDSPRTGCEWRITPLYMQSEQALVREIASMVSIVACCHGAKLCA